MKTINYFLTILIALVLYSCGGGDTTSGIFCSNDILIPFQEDSNKDWGFMDIEGNVIVEPEFNQRPSFAINNIALTMNKKGKYEFIKIEGGKVIEDDNAYDAAGMFSDGLAFVRNKNEKVQFINENFEIVFSSDAEEVGSFNSGLAHFKNDLGKWGFIDKSGDDVIKAQYDAIVAPFNDGYAIVSDRKEGENEFSIIDEGGEVVLALKDKYTRVAWISNELIAVYDQGWGYIDMEGEKVIKPDEDITSITPFKNGYASFQEENEWGLFDLEGNKVLKAKYSSPLYVIGDMIGFEDDGEWGFMDIEGKEIIAPNFDQVAYSFMCGNAIVKDGKHYTIIDENGDEVNADFECENLASFESAPASVHGLPNTETLQSDYFDVSDIVTKVFDAKKLVSMKNGADVINYLELDKHDVLLTPTRYTMGQMRQDWDYDSYSYKYSGPFTSDKSVSRQLFEQVYEYVEGEDDFSCGDGDACESGEATCEGGDHEDRAVYTGLEITDNVVKSAPASVESVVVNIRCKQPIAKTKDVTFSISNGGDAEGELDAVLKTTGYMKANPDALVNKIEYTINLSGKGIGKSYYLAKMIGEKFKSSGDFSDEESGRTDDENSDDYTLILKKEGQSIVVSNSSRHQRVSVVIRID